MTYKVTQQFIEVNQRVKESHKTLIAQGYRLRITLAQAEKYWGIGADDGINIGGIPLSKNCSAWHNTRITVAGAHYKGNTQFYVTPFVHSLLNQAQPWLYNGAVVYVYVGKINNVTMHSLVLRGFAKSTERYVTRHYLDEYPH